MNPIDIISQTAAEALEWRFSLDTSRKCHDLYKLEVWLRGWRDTKHNDTQHNDTQHNDTQYNDTRHNDTQHNDTQHNDIQHNEN